MYLRAADPETETLMPSLKEKSFLEMRPKLTLTKDRTWKVPQKLNRDKKFPDLAKQKTKPKHR